MPACLREGIAQYVEKTNRRRNSKYIINRAIKEGNFIPLTELFRIDSRKLNTMDEASVDLFYAESIEVIEYLIEKHGKFNFSIFWEELKEGNDFNSALKWAFNYDNISELNDAWLKYFGR